jgi:serine/threonine protein kinase
VLRDKLGLVELTEVEIGTQYHRQSLLELYDLIDLLGIGSFGVVLKAWNKKTHEMIALKISRYDEESMQSNVMEERV